MPKEKTDARIESHQIGFKLITRWYQMAPALRNVGVFIVKPTKRRALPKEKGFDLGKYFFLWARKFILTS